MTPEAFRQIVSGARRGPMALLARGLLTLAEQPYRLAMDCRNARYDNDPRRIHRAGAMVISVGNITLGGTGKTPLTVWLAKWFLLRGVRVALVSRGYGANDGKSNDEAREVAQQLPDVPHIQNKDRVAAAQLAVSKYDSQLILVDDGFQHRRLHRDLDIVVIDALAPFGYDRVFPRGMLREPMKGLRRTDLLVLSRADQVGAETRRQIKQTAARQAPNGAWVDLMHQPSSLIQADGPSTSIDQLRNTPIAAFCGIGNPRGFHTTLQSIGYDVRAFREFPDHHNYGDEDMKSLAKWANQVEAAALVCTHKDLVKINSNRLADIPLWALAIEIHVVVGEEILTSQLNSILAQIDS